MSEPIKLVTKPTVSTEVREAVVEELRGLLIEAEAGTIETVVVIAQYHDGRWSCSKLKTAQVSQTVGRLEIMKSEWIMQILKDS